MTVASYMNGLRGLEPFRIYGILSDSMIFEYFGYDGKIFYQDVPIALLNEAIRDTPQDKYLSAMGKGM